MTNLLFFELLQVSLGKIISLSKKPSDEEWKQLFKICQKQSITGIAFTAIDKLSESGHKPPLPILYEWIGQSGQIKQQNRIVNQNVVALCNELEKDGFDCCILKGQGNATLYDVGSKKENGRCLALLRMPGDIDVWVIPKSDGRYKKEDIKRVIRYVKKRNPQGKAMYHHIDYGLYNGTEVEVHYRPSFMFNPIHNRRLQKWYKKMADGGWLMAELPEGAGSIRIPNREFNIVFQLSHIYNHLLHEGIGLRQIIDYFYALKSNTNRTNDTNIINLLNYLGLAKIAGAMMWVLHEKLGLAEKFLIAPIDERRGNVLLDEIMRGGNFGHYDSENIKATNRLKKNVQRIKRDLRLIRYFPSECIWELWFRIYHLFWRLSFN